MTALKLILKALQNNLPNTLLVDKFKMVRDTTFPAYKRATLEIWAIRKSEKKRLCGMELTRKVTSDTQEEKLMNDLTTLILPTLLKMYKDEAI